MVKPHTDNLLKPFFMMEVRLSIAFKNRDIFTSEHLKDIVQQLSLIIEELKKPNFSISPIIKRGNSNMKLSTIKTWKLLDLGFTKHVFLLLRQQQEFPDLVSL
ncbi:hypothetical protein ACOSP7_005228 [Xanthoceras sorbifolium]